LELLGLTLSELDGKLAIVIDYKKEEIYLVVEKEELILTGKEAAFILESLEKVIQHLTKNFQIMKEPNSNIN
jgi:hypothetical protein